MICRLIHINIVTMKKSIVTIICVLLSLATYSQSDKRPDNYNYNRAMEALDNQNVEEAIEYLGKELKENPKNGYAYSWAAYIYRYREEYGHAISAADKALQYLPKKDTEYVSFALSIRAEVYKELKEYDKALADYARAIKGDPERTQLYKDRAQLLYELEKYDQADKDYQKISELDQGDVVGYVGLGRNDYARKNYDDAIEKYSYAIKLSPTYAQGYSFRAESYMGQKKYNEAIDDIIKALEINGDGKAYYLMQEVADSASTPLIAKLKIQAASDPNKNSWPYYIGIVYDINKNYRQAINWYSKSYEKDSKPFIADLIADCYDDLGDYDKALYYIDMAINQDSTDVDFIYRKANCLDHAGRSKEALSVMDDYVNKAPRDFRGYYWRGWIKDHTNDLDGAIEDYTISVTLNPDYAYGILNRGRMYLLKNEMDLAKSDFEEAIAKDTVDGGRSAAMYSYIYLGKYDEATRIINHILEKDSKENCYEAACAYSLMNNKEKALVYLRKALEGGYYEFNHMRRDRDLDNIRTMPEFETLLKEYEDKVNRENGGEDGAKDEYEEQVSEVPFMKEGGVYKVKCEINKLPLHFIFDTGASDVSISNVEAAFMLKNNYLVANDFVGTQNYMNANGEISEGTVINLRSVDFAGLSLTNIKASVVKNQKAPLLLGQSVLGKLGKIEIDNEKRMLKVTSRKKK